MGPKIVTSAKAQVQVGRGALPSGFEEAEDQTAGPSTSLRSGRDENIYWVIRFLTKI
jgi:hypothetical protein